MKNEEVEIEKPEAVNDEEKGEKTNAVKEPIAIVLTPKQRTLLMSSVEDRLQYEQGLQAAQRKESELTSLILDANNIDEELVLSVEGNPNTTVLNVTMK